jgi:hypothetical protein
MGGVPGSKGVAGRPETKYSFKLPDAQLDQKTEELTNLICLLSGSQHYLNKKLIELSFRVPPSFAETLVEIMAEFLRKLSEKRAQPYTEEQIQEFCLSLRKSYEEGKVNLKTIENKIDEEYLKGVGTI